jgi:hypothetical protein
MAVAHGTLQTTIIRRHPFVLERMALPTQILSNLEWFRSVGEEVAVSCQAPAQRGLADRRGRTLMLGDDAKRSAF